MDSYGELIDESTVRFDWLLPTSVEDLWSYLVDGEKKARWLCGGSVEEREGGAVAMRFENAALSDAPDIDPPEKYSGLPGVMKFTGTVTECDKPRVLAHTWDADDGCTDVRYELAEQDGQARLTIVHSKLSAPNQLLGCAGGWHTHLTILRSILADAPAPPFWRMHTPLEAEYAERFGL